MTPAGDDASAGSVRGDLSNRPTVVLPGQRGGAAAKRPSSPSRAPMLVVVAANVVWAALVSLLPVLVTVGGITLAASQRPEAGSTLRYALGAWLLAHGVPLRLGGYPLTLIPLAISILAFWRVVVAGRNSVRATHSPASLVAISFAIGYALIGVAAAGLADDRFVSVSAVRAAVTLALFGGVGAFAGAYTGSGLARRAWRRLPRNVAEGVCAGAIAALLLLAAGAVTTGISIATAGDSASRMLHNYHAGVGGQAGLVLICLVYAPNVTVWATAYLAGPGFTLAGAIQLPVFAGLPTHPAAGAWQLLLLLPVLAGAAAGILTARSRKRDNRSIASLVSGAVLAGLIAAVGFAIIGYLAAGSLGVKLLTHTGEVGWQFSVVGGAGIAIGMLLGSVAYRLIRRDIH
jgi:hypothetical protein